MHQAAARLPDHITVVRAYLSEDGAVVLADPMLGSSNAASEPPVTVVVSWTDSPGIPEDRPPTNACSGRDLVVGSHDGHCEHPKHRL